MICGSDGGGATGCGAAGRTGSGGEFFLAFVDSECFVFYSASDSDDGGSVGVDCIVKDYLCSLWMACGVLVLTGLYRSGNSSGDGG